MMVAVAPLVMLSGCDGYVRWLMKAAGGYLVLDGQFIVKDWGALVDWLGAGKSLIHWT